MHQDEQVATAEQVSSLVADQFPQWAGLPVREVAEFGTDHCLFRVGDDLVARMPRASWAVDQAASDARWLPLLLPHLPVTVPVPLAIGTPGRGYPWPWSVVPWLPGATPTAYDERGAHLADSLAEFVRALHAVPTADGPHKRSGSRGAPLADIDETVREAIAACGNKVESVDWGAVTALWDDCVTAPTWTGPPTWIHGDLLVGNLLVHDGRLSGVIDFGALGVGDPAPDLLPAWCVLPATARQRFRDLVGYDDATWRRGRGWALGPALTGIPYYWDSVPAFAERGLRTIEVLLADIDRDAG